MIKVLNCNRIGILKSFYIYSRLKPKPRCFFATMLGGLLNIENKVDVIHGVTIRFSGNFIFISLIETIYNF